MTASTDQGNKTDKSAATNVSGSDDPNLKGDWCNLFLLLLLYTLQGLPLGLVSQAIPMLLKSNKNANYNDQV